MPRTFASDVLPTRMVSPPVPFVTARGPTHWTETLLREAVETLQGQIGKAQPGGLEFHAGNMDSIVVDAIVRLGMQPEIHAALCQRRDPAIAIRDLATRYAFSALMAEGRSFYELDPMSQVLVQHTLDLIYKRAAQVAQQVGEDPLDAEDRLLLAICTSLSRYVPRKPMSAHITWKLNHYESAVSRAVRQIENLVIRPEVVERFADYILSADAPDQLRAQLLQLARGGGRHGLDYAAAIRFFALPETIAFVKGLAGTIQTARTLYAEDEYDGIVWQGARRLSAGRRQGYIELALAQLIRKQQVSLDDDTLNLDRLCGVTWDEVDWLESADDDERFLD